MVAKLSLLHQEAIPYLYYRDAAAAVEFLSKAFGFDVRSVQRGDSGAVMHAELGVGASAVMLGPAAEQFGFKAPNELPARHAGVWCYVVDSDAHCARARAAGAVIVREPTNQFYGVREYTARDSEGHEWFFSTPLPGRAATPPAKRAAKMRAKTRAAKPQAAKTRAKARPARKRRRAATRKRR